MTRELGHLIDWFSRPGALADFAYWDRRRALLEHAADGALTAQTVGVLLGVSAQRAGDLVTRAKAKRYDRARAADANDEMDTLRKAAWLAHHFGHRLPPGPFLMPLRCPDCGRQVLPPP
jgi:hypothetical protein